MDAHDMTTIVDNPQIECRRNARNLDFFMVVVVKAFMLELRDFAKRSRHHDPRVVYPDEVVVMAGKFHRHLDEGHEGDVHGFEIGPRVYLPHSNFRFKMTEKQYSAFILTHMEDMRMLRIAQHHQRRLAVTSLDPCKHGVLDMRCHLQTSFAVQNSDLLFVEHGL